MSSVDQTLDERGRRYGEFDEHARITQNIKAAMKDSRNWTALDDDMREALEMIAHKIGRILNGDPKYIDSWHDIIGYTRLVEQRLENEERTSANPIGRGQIMAQLQERGIMRKPAEP
jgi:uncharacterized protein (UPF0297 family)